MHKTGGFAKFSIILTLAAVVSMSTAWAETFTLTRSSDGQRFYCTEPGSGGTNPGPTDPNCLPTLSSYCYQVTSHNQDQCYTLATQACAKGVSPSCVSSSEGYCYQHTSHNHDQCFDLAVSGCGGHGAAIQNMMESVRQGAILERQGIDLKALKTEALKTPDVLRDDASKFQQSVLKTITK